MLTPTRTSRGEPSRAGHALERLDDAQPGAHGALGVVLVHGGHAEDADHGVADELLDGAAVGLDHLAGGGVIPPQDGVDVLGVGGLAHGREGDEVAEEGGDGLALVGASARGDENRAALPAELEADGILSLARDADAHRPISVPKPVEARTASVSANAGFAPSRAKISRAAARGAAASGALPSATRQRPWPSNACPSS